MGMGATTRQENRQVKKTKFWAIQNKGESCKRGNQMTTCFKLLVNQLTVSHNTG